MLDTFSLKMALGAVTLTLCLLFFASSRRTGSPYSAWWCVALASWLSGNIVYLFNGTDHQLWANPLGNALLVSGSFSAWAGCRSLRGIGPRRWPLLLAPIVTLGASFLANPAENAWSGGVVYFGLMGFGLAFAARELILLPGDSRAQRSVLLAAAALVIFFTCRAIVYGLAGPDGEFFRTYLGPGVTSILLIVLLVTVSFSMTTLSNDRLVTALSERAARDGMTGLLNRETFLDQARAELIRLDGSKSVSTLVLADLDHFKSVNDTFGHAAGDAAIHAFADALRASVRRTDLVGRFGGEEFILFLPEADAEKAKAITAGISQRYRSTAAPDGVVFPTVSYGIASTALDSSLTRLTQAADGALYEAKARGRDQAVCSPDESQWALYRADK